MMGIEKLPRTLLRCASVYALLGIGFGIYMAISMDFLNRGVHIHANLVGWVSMAQPAMAFSKLAMVQFWAHNLPVMLVRILGLLHQHPFGNACAGIGSLVVALAFVSFANVWRNAD